MRAELGGSMIAGDGGGRAGRQAGRAARPHRDAHARRRAPVGQLGGAVGREASWRVAQREAERTEQLVRGGRAGRRATSTSSRNTVSAVEAQLADAKSRLASAERQLGDAVIRAPLAGIVSSRSRERRATSSASGTELFTVIDPVVDAARGVGAVRRPVARCASAPTVEFKVRGYEQTVPGHDRAHRAAGRPDDAAGADLRGDSQRRRPARGRPLRRGAGREPVGRPASSCRRTPSTPIDDDAVGAARDRRQDRARRR